jgi:hypothetical protein
VFCGARITFGYNIRPDLTTPCNTVEMERPRLARWTGLRRKDVRNPKKMIAKPQAPSPTPRSGPSPTPEWLTTAKKAAPNIVRCDQKFQPSQFATTFDTTYSRRLRFSFLNTARHHSSIFVLLSSSMGQNTVPSKPAFPPFHGLNGTYSFPLESASTFRTGAFDLRSEGVVWLLAHGPS